MMTIPSHPQYKIFKHAEVKSGDRQVSTGDPEAIKSSVPPLPPRPIRRWNRDAQPSEESRRFLERLERDADSNVAKQRKNTVFVNSAVQNQYTTRGLLHLLAEHVTDNHIKVGKKVYRQRKGIPQGSVLSSFLCNYFYADLEAKHLGFLKDNGPVAGHTLLLRLIDDFLLITTDKSKAVRFAETLHRGIPEYGVRVNHKKSLANFPVSVPSDGGACDDGHQPLATMDGRAEFPYCGILINCQTLDISKDCERDKKIGKSIYNNH